LTDTVNACKLYPKRLTSNSYVGLTYFYLLMWWI